MFITFLYISLCVTVSVIHGDESSTTALPRQRISPTPTGTTDKYTTVASSTINNLDEQNITFALSASDIPGKDQLTKADAFVQVFAIDGENNEERLGSTEVIDNQDNPFWTNVFWLMWKRGTGQKLKFVVKDFDRLTLHDDIGEATISVDEYMNRSTVPGDREMPGLDIAVPLTNELGSLRIRRTYPKSFGLYARYLPHLDTFDGLSDPFVEIYWKQGKNGENHLIGTTAVINNQENPNFPETFEFSNYVPGAYQYMTFKVWDSDSITSNDEIGEVEIDADTVFKDLDRKVVNLHLIKGSNAKLTVFARPFYTPGVTYV